MAECRSTEWARQALGHRSTSSSSSGPPRHTASSRGFATLTRQMGKLNVRTTNIDESVTNMAPFMPFQVILVIEWQCNQWD